MKFTMLVAILATVQMATAAQSEPTVVLIPNAQVYNQQPAAQTQPATVVEAAPVSESKAEAMRKARQNQELQTEQKIVEKLEESRLREEQQRAERLFGDKLNDSAAPVAAPVAAPAPAPAVAEPVVAPAQPQQVTIEKIEIVQPPVQESKEKAAPAEAQSVVDVSNETPEPVFNKKFYVGGTLAVPSYGAANLKTNYGAGFVAGIQIDPNWAVEGMFLFSNHVVDTFWKAPLYSEMDQYDLQATAKYYVMTDKLKPYVGASTSYVTRVYTDRIKSSYAYQTSTDKSESQETYTMNVGLVAGVDYEVSNNITIGGGIDYNTPIMKKNEFSEQRFGLPENTKPVEEFDYTTIKVNARISF